MAPSDGSHFSLLRSFYSLEGYGRCLSKNVLLNYLRVNKERTVMGYNSVVYKTIDQFIDDYINCVYIPRTEADIQGYLFALCLKELMLNRLDLDIHLNYPNPYLDNQKHKKIDIVIGTKVAVEIKFEADYTGVSKPVVFPKDAISDLDRLKSMKARGMEHCHFIFLDEDGTHFRNLQKYTEDKLNWKLLSISGVDRYFLHVEL